MNMMAEFDATATMECWLPSELPNLSFSHIWSSSPAFIVPRYFFGLSVTSPGAAALSVRPQPGPVLAGQASLPTVKGPVLVSFRQTLPGTPGGCFELQTTTPGGSILRAYVPLWGASPVNVTLVLDGARVASPGVDGDYLYVDGLGSGAHTLTTC
jgi:alpha-L-rhamnosidase